MTRVERFDVVSDWAVSGMAVAGGVSLLVHLSSVGQGYATGEAFRLLAGLLGALVLLGKARQALVNRLSPLDPIPAGWEHTVSPRFLGDSDWFIGYRAKAWETDPAATSEGPLAGWCWTQRSARQQLARRIQEEIERQATERAEVSS